jgi:hypothetical protein
MTNKIDARLLAISVGSSRCRCLAARSGGAWRARARAFPVASGRAPHRAQDPHPRLLTQDGLPCTPSDLFGKRGKELIGSYPMAPNVDLLVTGGAVNGGAVP